MAIMAFVSPNKGKKKPGIKDVTLEVKYVGSRWLDTINVKNAKSPLCIADFQNGESCLICGKDSVITCNVEDYRVLEVK